MNIYDELAEHFAERGYTWNIGGLPLIPVAEDIEQAVDKAVAMLYAENDGAMLEVGRLIIQKTGKTYDIYMHMGETK